MGAKTILIVEDEIGPRESLRMILGAHYQVESAENGLMAVEILKRQSIDGVTLDLRMPGPSGIEVLKQIKKKWPSIQVLVITGYATLRTALDAIRYGAFHYLQKPFDIDELVDTMHRMIRKKEQMDHVDSLTNRQNLQNGEESLPSPKSDSKAPVLAFSDFENMD